MPDDAPSSAQGGPLSAGLPPAADSPPGWADRVRRLWHALPERWTASVAPRTVAAAGAVVLGLVLAGGGAAWWFMHRASGRAPGLDLPRADAAAPHGGGAATDGAPVSSLPGPGSDSGGTITVAAGGAVARPGVYVVAAKSRVADVIAAAGGASSDADLDEVNLAAKVSDADRVFVPRQGQPVPAVVGSGGGGGPPGGGGGGGGATGGAATANSPLDLNSATAEQLDALPGVGPATAQAIVAYRQSHGGRFKSVNELLEVRGIGPAKFDALRSLVRVQ